MRSPQCDDVKAKFYLVDKWDANDGISGLFLGYAAP